MTSRRTARVPPCVSMPPPFYLRLLPSDYLPFPFRKKGPVYTRKPALARSCRELLGWPHAKSCLPPNATTLMCNIAHPRKPAHIRRTHSERRGRSGRPGYSWSIIYTQRFHQCPRGFRCAAALSPGPHTRGLRVIFMESGPGRSLRLWRSLAACGELGHDASESHRVGDCAVRTKRG